MSLVKVAIDSLLSIQQTMRKAWDDIVNIKLEVDYYCYCFEWDDPVGRNFIAKYEEGIAPIKEKLLPMLEQYADYLSKLMMNISEYAEASHIHISGTEDIMNVLPKGTPIDPITIAPDAVPHIPNETLQPINTDSVIPAPEEYSGTWELQPGEQITLDDGSVIEVSSIPNGCGTVEGFGHWAGRTGAGVDAFLNSVPIVAPVIAGGVALVGIVGGLAAGSVFGPVGSTAGAVAGGASALIAISETGQVLNPKEYLRLNNGACADHDICYVYGDKFVCEQNLRNDGGRFMSIFTSKYGGSAYEHAQREGEDSQIYIGKAQIISGKRIILPEGYVLRPIVR